MGLYRAANAAYLAKVDATPDITKHETFGAVKYGFGLNAEQELTEELRVFGRSDGTRDSTRATSTPRSIRRLNWAAISRASTGDAPTTRWDSRL